MRVRRNTSYCDSRSGCTFFWASGRESLASQIRSVRNPSVNRSRRLEEMRGMPLDGKVKFLRENIDSQVESFSRRRNSNKQKAFLVKLGTSAAAGTATVILGFQGYIDPVWAKNIALILSALITFVSAWDAYFNHRALWLR